MKHLALTALLGLASTAALAAGPAEPAKAPTCFACHGQGGLSTNGMYPILAGQHTNYIEQALHEYKSGERKNPIMGAQAAGLSEADIRELALYFNAQPGPLHTPTEQGALK
ncbi:MAG: c-type cytochrome [Stenotrophobium sp.]